MSVAILRQSSFVHLLDLGPNQVLAVHALTQMRLTVTPPVGRLIRFFSEPQALDAVLPQLQAAFCADATTIRAALASLLDRGILTALTAAEETADAVGALVDTHGRDPGDLLDQYRRKQMDGAHPYWSVEAALGLDDAVRLRRRIDILLLGDCDVQMETGFLRHEAAGRGIDLRAAASFAVDTGLAAERQHDAIIIGALQARHAITVGDPEHHAGDPARVYVDAVETMVRKLRILTAAPILIDGLPEPTLQPMGLADRGIHSHRNRFRRTNLALTQLAEAYPDVHLVDVAAALNAAGSASLVDDGLVSFTHFGSPGWMLQRPSGELAAVHGAFPDLAPLAIAVDGKPYGREAVMARTHMDVLSAVLSVGSKKCVIVDLDGVLWPGVLAETGAPFAWSPEVSGPNSFVGLYFGIHEALRTLRRRGILLACVSKNDEATVRALWHYGQVYPRHRLLTLDHFVSIRINWEDKARNIESLSQELGFSLDAFLFVDDSERERERVREALPEVEVLGDDLFAVRRALLTHPGLQPVRMTAEAARRSDGVKAQIDRARLRKEAADEGTFVASLAVVSTVEQLVADDIAAIDRVRELISRTTQFNATGVRFTEVELRHVIGSTGGRVFVLRMRDRLADHGLVGAAVVLGGEILNFVLSCRVIGLGGERVLLDAVAADARAGGVTLSGRIVQTDRNVPVRHLYSGSCFADCGNGVWTMTREEALADG